MRRKDIIRRGWVPFRIGASIIYYSQKIGISLHLGEAEIIQDLFEYGGYLNIDSDYIPPNDLKKLKEEMRKSNAA